MAKPSTKDEMKVAYKLARDDICSAYNTEDYENINTGNVGNIMNMTKAEILALGFSEDVAGAMFKWCSAFKDLAPEYQTYKAARVAFKTEMERIKDILV